MRKIAMVAIQAGKNTFFYFRDGKIVNSSEYGLIEGCSNPNDIVIYNETFSDVDIIDKP